MFPLTKDCSTFETVGLDGLIETKKRLRKYQSSVVIGSRLRQDWRTRKEEEQEEEEGK